MVSVSIIVPAYNSEAYLDRALASIKRQTLTQFEVIIINDGSKDNTESIAKNYLDDARFHYFFQENGGLSAARNHGLDHAQGKYIYFLDSDDWIADDFLEKMVQKAEHTDADIVLSTIQISENEKSTKRNYALLNVSDDENLRNYYEPMHFHPIMQNKLIRSSLIEGNTLRFPVGLYYEDVYFFTCAFTYASRVYGEQRADFYYFQHDSSIMKDATLRLLEIESILTLLMEKFPYFKNETWFEYFCIRHLYFASTLRAIQSKDRQIKKAIFQSHERFINTHFRHWRHNVYLKERKLYSSRGQYLYGLVLRLYGYKIAHFQAQLIYLK